MNLSKTNLLGFGWATQNTPHIKQFTAEVIYLGLTLLTPVKEALKECKQEIEKRPDVQTLQKILGKYPKHPGLTAHSSSDFHIKLLKSRPGHWKEIGNRQRLLKENNVLTFFEIWERLQRGKMGKQKYKNKYVWLCVKPQKIAPTKTGKTT